MTTTEVTTQLATSPEPVKVSPNVRAVEWVRRTWQPTQEQVQAFTRIARAVVEKRLAGSAEKLRALLGGPTREELGELSRRLTRIEARLEAMGGPVKEGAREKERRSA